MQTNGLCALIDSHVHNINGAIIVVADCPSKLISAYSSMPWTAAAENSSLEFFSILSMIIRS